MSPPVCLIRYLLSGWVLLLLCVGSWQTAWAQDHITQRAWLEDTSGQLSWPAVQQQAAHPYAGMLSSGFGDSTIWLKLHIDPNAHPAPAYSENRLVLRIRPVYLDDIQVYDPLAPQGLVGTTGDLHHPRHCLALEPGLDMFTSTIHSENLANRSYRARAIE